MQQASRHPPRQDAVRDGVTGPGKLCVPGGPCPWTLPASSARAARARRWCPWAPIVQAFTRPLSTAQAFDGPGRRDAKEKRGGRACRGGWRPPTTGACAAPSAPLVGLRGVWAPLRPTANARHTTRFSQKQKNKGKTCFCKIITSSTHMEQFLKNWPVRNRGHKKPNGTAGAPDSHRMRTRPCEPGARRLLPGDATSATRSLTLTFPIG